MTQDKVFLFGRVTNHGFNENVSEVLHRVYNLAYAP
jgi:hypothetical protein